MTDIVERLRERGLKTGDVLMFDAAKEIEGLRKHYEQVRQDFCAAIDHAISLGLEGADFLRCWNEGDWDGCAEFDFVPSEQLMRGYL